MRGFTLMETLLSIGVLLLIAALTMPVGVNFYQRQTVDEAAENLAANLRQARSQAVAGLDDDSYGLYLNNSGYTLFKGANYYDRMAADDVVITLDPGLKLTGTTEVVFDKMTGSSQPADYMVSAGNISSTIHVNAQGVVSKP